MATIDTQIRSQVPQAAPVPMPQNGSRAPSAGPVAIITGAASGIGRALADQLGARGARLILADLNPRGIEQVEKQLQFAGVDAVGLAVDVSDPASIDKIVDTAMARHGRIDLLFNNAGVGWGGMFETMSTAEIERVVSINLSSILRATSAVYPVMIQQRSGHIINVASVDGLIPKPHLAVYCATKHGITAFSHALGIESRAHGVFVSVVCPGLVNTSIRQTSAAILRDTAESGKAPPAGRMMSAEQCAQKILAAVDRKQETIIVAFFRPIWWFYRLSPRLFRALTAPLFLRKKGYEQTSWLARAYSGSLFWLVRFARTGRIR
jgi:short-subunit dehydrogenase